MSAKPQYIQTTDGPGIGHNSGAVTVSELPWTTDDLINFGQENYHFGSRPTYDRLATNGFGPPFRKAGKLRLYDPPKARAWLAARVSPEVTSTSELAKPAAAAISSASNINALEATVSGFPSTRGKQGDRARRNSGREGSILAKSKNRGRGQNRTEPIELQTQAL